ncbi:hypothetical protein UlMin_020144 [Ulmus minor]
MSSVKMGRHVGVFPFPFTSHPYSMLTLVRKLAKAAPNVQFSFFNTSNSNNSLFGFTSKVELEHNIKAYDVEDGMPVGHVFSGNPVEPMNVFLKAKPKIFKRAMDMATSETGLKISCLLFDAFFCDLLKDIAKDLSIPWIVLFPASPLALSTILYGDLIRKQVAEAMTDFIPGLSELQISDIEAEIICSAHLLDQPIKQAAHRMGDLLPRATAVVLNCYREITPTLLTNDLESKFQTLLNVGFPTLPLQLPPSDSDQTGCLSWLDGQKTRSVVYISCGTVDIALPESEIIALVEALEENKISFLWSIKESFKKLLPDGFVERTSSYGKVVSWAPQSLVLAHESIGAYMTHCGYNSMNEGIVNCVPMICRPIWADNHINARMIESVWGIGTKVEEDGFLTKSGLVRSFQLILGEQGKKMKEKADSLKQLVLEASGPNGSAMKDFQTLVGLISRS